QTDQAKTFAAIVTGNPGAVVQATAIIHESDKELVNGVASDDNAMGYVSFQAVTKKVAALGYGDDWAFVRQPLEEEIRSGHYKLARRIVLVTSKESSKVGNELASFLTSPRVHSLLKGFGWVPAAQE